MAVATNSTTYETRLFGLPTVAFDLSHRDTRPDSRVRMPPTQSDLVAEGLPEAVGFEIERLEREAVFDRAYKSLSSRRGANATASGRSRGRQFWRQEGSHAAVWLAGRIAQEDDLQTAQAASEALSELGHFALDATLRQVEASEANRHWAPLLDALGWMDLQNSDTLSRCRFEIAIRRAANAADIDVRQAAVRAARALGPVHAPGLLAELRQVASPSVLTEIDELLAEILE